MLHAIHQTIVLTNFGVVNRDLRIVGLLLYFIGLDEKKIAAEKQKGVSEISKSRLHLSHLRNEKGISGLVR